MRRAARKACRYRVDVIGLRTEVNFSHYVVEANSPEEAIAKVTSATGITRLVAHPITAATLLKGWLLHIEDQVRLHLNF